MLGIVFAVLGGFAFADADLVWDDAALLEVHLPTVQSWQEFWVLPEGFRQWYGENQRPLSLLSLALDNHLWGQDYRGHHWSQALGYGLVVALFCSLVQALLRIWSPQGDPKRRQAAVWLAGLLFALHPTHVESAAWLSARNDLVSAALFLIAARATLAALEARASSVAWFFSLAAGAASLGSLLAKESGIAAAAVVVLMVALVQPEGSKRKWGLALPSVAATALLFLFRGGPQLPSLAEDVGARWFGALGWQWQALVRPFGHRLFYEPPAPEWGYLALAFWFFTGLLALAEAVRRRPWWLFFWAWALLTLAPSWAVAWWPLMESTVADRYLLLPVAALALWIGWAVSQKRAWATGLGIAAVLAFGAGSLRYGAVWAGPPGKLALHMSEAAPTNLSIRLAAIRRCQRAQDAETLETVFALKPEPIETPHQKGRLAAMRSLVLYSIGDMQGASEAAIQATEQGPDDARHWQQLGFLRYQIYRSLVNDPKPGQEIPRLLGEARFALGTAVQKEPRSYRSWFYLGRTHMALNELPQARNAFLKTIEHGGSQPETDWARSLDQIMPLPPQGWGKRVEEAKQRARESRRPAEAWHQLGMMLKELYLDTVWLSPQGQGPAGPVREARDCFEQALGLQPKMVEAHYELGLVCATLRDWPAAKQAFDNTIRYGAGTVLAHWAKENLEGIATEHAATEQ